MVKMFTVFAKAFCFRGSKENLSKSKLYKSNYK